MREGSNTDEKEKHRFSVLFIYHITVFPFERKASEKKQKALSANSFIPFYSEFKFIMFSQILTLQSANKSIAFFIPQNFLMQRNSNSANLKAKLEG